MRKRFAKKLFSLVLIFSLVLTLFPFAASATGQQPDKTKFDRSSIDVSKFIKKDVSLSDLERVFISPDIDTTSSSKVKVIVELSQHPLSVEKGVAEQQGKFFSAVDEKSALTKIKTAQAEFASSLKTLKVSANIHRSYQRVFNGFALELPAKQVPMLAKAKNVAAVYPVIEYNAAPVETEPMMTESGPFIGSTQIWNDLGITGEGIKVGVVDTGIDYFHPDLKDVYVGGYDFVNNDADPYETTPGERPETMPEVNSSGNTYWTSHGTHVSGTIASQGVQTTGVMGVAPGVELYAYKVLGPYGSGTSEWVIAGIEQAVTDGMDVINLSLGASLNDPDYPTSRALNNAMLAGTVAVTSAGNSGPERWTMGSPGTSAFAITVGASTPPGDLPLATGVSSLAETIYDLRVMAFNPAEDYQTALLNSPLEIVYVGLGYPTDYEGKDLTGKIALIKRGDFAFVDKVAFAKNAGAAAAIIFNRDGLDEQIGYFLGDSLDYIPTFDMSGIDGRALVEALQATTSPTILKIENENLNKEESAPVNVKPVNEEMLPIVPAVEEPGIVTPKGSAVTTSALPTKPTEGEITPATFTITGFDNERYLGDEMASFSSRGPVKKTLDIKPDVVAPGVSIKSTVAAYGKEDTAADYTYAYERYQGTSMASPHVAALAALILQKNPDYTPFEVKAALMNNALIIGETGEYTVFDQGAGRVQGYEAVTATTLAQVLDKTKYTIDGVLTEVDDITGSISFGQAPLDSDFLASKTIQLKNMDNVEHSYTVSAFFTNTITDGVSLTFEQSSYVVPVNGTYDITATMAVDHTVAPDGEYQGYIFIADNNNQHTMQIPFVVYVGELNMPKGFGEVFQYPVDFSPNGDGVLDTTGIYFEVFSEMNEQALLVWDPVAYYEGYNGGYIGQVLYFGEGETAPPGFWGIEGYDGEYFDYRTGSWQYLSNGYYTLDWHGWDDETGPSDNTNSEPYVVWNDLYVDRNAPKVWSNDYESIYKITDGSFTFEGSLYDMYIDFGEPDKVSATYEVINYDVPTFSQTGDIVFAEDGSFSLSFTELPEGLNRLMISTSDIAGNEGSNRFYLAYGVPTAEYNLSSSRVELGGTVEVYLTADGVDNLVGAQFELDYDDNVFTLEKVEASQAFTDAAGESGYVEVTNDDLFYTSDGLKRVAVGVAYQGEVEGVSGENHILTVTFSVTNDESVIDNWYYFEPENIKFVDKNLVDYYPNLTSSMGVKITAPTQSITGTIQPEAFMENGLLKEGVDFSQLGASIVAYNEYEGFEGVINPDGTFIIDGLSADGVYTLELRVPGHFKSILQGVKTVEEVVVDGVATYQPADITVDFGLLLAGDANGDDVIDIIDVVYVARHFGMAKTSEGTWPSPNAQYGDFNQDGVIDVNDLSFVTTHFMKINELVPYVNTTPLSSLPSGEQFEF